MGSMAPAMAPGYAVFKPTDFGNDLEATTCWLTNLHLDSYTYRMSHFFLSEVENGIIKCYVNCRWMCSLMFTGVHNQTQETNIEIFWGSFHSWPTRRGYATPITGRKSGRAFEPGHRISPEMRYYFVWKQIACNRCLIQHWAAISGT